MSQFAMSVQPPYTAASGETSVTDHEQPGRSVAQAQVTDASKRASTQTQTTVPNLSGSHATPGMSTNQPGNRSRHSSLEVESRNTNPIVAGSHDTSGKTTNQLGNSPHHSHAGGNPDNNNSGFFRTGIIALILFLLLATAGLTKLGFNKLADLRRDQRVQQMQHDQELQSLQRDLNSIDVKVTTDAVKTNKLTVNGTSDLKGPTSVQGDTTVDGNVAVNGNISADNFQGSTNGTHTGRSTGSHSGTFQGSFSGDGTKLNNVDAETLDGNDIRYYRNASNLNAGTLSDDRLSSNIAQLNRDNQTFTGTNTFTQDVTVNGATNLADLTASSAAITGTVSVGGDLQTQNLLAGNNLSLQGGSGVIRYAQGGFSTTLDFTTPTSDTSILFPALAAGSYQVCTNSGNCVGGGGSAPSGADFLTLSANPSLSNERVFTMGANLQATDGGANNNYTVSVVANPTFTNGTFTGNLTAQSILQNGNTVCDNSNNCSYAASSGSANYIQNGTSTQTANMNISGNGYFGGNVGIGTTTPTDKLTVAGDINISDATKGYKIDNNRILFASDTNYSTLVGNGAGQALLGDGNFNSALGYQALYNTTTGDYNTATGYRSLYSNTTGSFNTAYGVTSLSSNTTGSYNLASGVNSLSSNTTGISNVAFGNSSLYYNTTGSNNTAIGHFSGRYIADGSTGNTTGSNSVFLGHSTKANADNETNQIVIGHDATGNGSNSVTLGNTSITKTVLQGSVGIGTTTPGAKLHVQGSDAAAIATIIRGAASQTADLLQVQDSAGAVLAKVGATGNLTVKDADVQGDLTVAGDINISDATKGYKIANNRILFASDTNYSTLVGNGAGQALLSDGYYNSALGYQALYSTTSGDNNTAVGYSSLYSNTTGSFNTALGQASLYSNTTGSNNSAYGRASLYSNTTGSNNSAYGRASLYSNTTGSLNTAIGHYSGRYIADGSTGNTTGSNSVFLGYNTKANADNETNQIVIGHDATGNGSNSVTLGNTSITKTVLQGSVGIGTSTPGAKLHISDGDVQVTDSTSDAIVNITSTAASGSARVVLTPSGTGSGVISSSSVLALHAGGTERLRVQSGGNVSIGTISSLAQLAVVNDAAGEVATVIRGAASQTADLLQVQGSAGTVLTKIDATGNLTVKTGDIQGDLTVAGDINISDATKGYKIANNRILFTSSANSSTLVGNGAGQALLSDGLSSSALGYQALYNTTSGDHNTATGFRSLYSNTTGNQNTANGYYSGRYIADGSTGNTTGSNSVFLGAYTKANADNETNQIVIGHNATGNGSNSVTLGNTSITKTVLQGNVGIGETTPSAKLSVTAASTTAYSATALSTIPTSSDGLIIKNSDNTSNNNFAGIILQNRSASVGSARIALTGGTDTSALTFQVRPTTGMAITQEFMRINSDGNVGIGTTTPGAKLHVQGSDAATVGQVIQAAASQTADLLQVQDSAGAVLAKVDATGNLTVKDAEVQGNLVVTGNATFNGSFITFSNNVRGFNVPVVSASSLAVTFSTAHANTNYAVMCTPSWNTTCYVTDKTATGFTLNFGTPSGPTDTVDWFAPR